MQQCLMQKYQDLRDITKTFKSMSLQFKLTKQMIWLGINFQKTLSTEYSCKFNAVF